MMVTGYAVECLSIRRGGVKEGHCSFGMAGHSRYRDSASESGCE